jgi:hypothetical protein
MFNILNVYIMKTKLYTQVLALLLLMTVGVQHAYAFNNNNSCLELFSKTYKLKINDEDSLKVGPINDSLPVSPINFDVVRNGFRIEAIWSITSKLHHNYFTLERSRNGKKFEKVSVIDAMSSINNLIQYLETDNQPLKGISYYRLKLTGQNNESTYSNSIKVNYTFAEKRQTNVVRKPLTSADLKLFLKNENNAEILMVLRDANGNEVYSKVIVAVENSEITGIDPENKLAAGTYIITATSNNLLYNQKLIVR